MEEQIKSKARTIREHVDKLRMEKVGKQRPRKFRDNISHNGSIIKDYQLRRWICEARQNHRRENSSAYNQFLKADPPGLPWHVSKFADPVTFQNGGEAKYNTCYIYLWDICSFHGLTLKKVFDLFFQESKIRLKEENIPFWTISFEGWRNWSTIPEDLRFCAGGSAPPH